MKIETQRTKRRTRAEPCDPDSLERGVRQLLADKISGNLVGLWRLIPEHLRLGTWDLLCGWSGQSGGRVEPRLALQLIHEAALCSTGLRHQRVLSQRGFELANGLPFVAGDVAVHDLPAIYTHLDADLAKAGYQRLLDGPLAKVVEAFAGRLSQFAGQPAGSSRPALPEGTSPIAASEKSARVDLRRVSEPRTPVSEPEDSQSMK